MPKITLASDTIIDLNELDRFITEEDISNRTFDPTISNILGLRSLLYQDGLKNLQDNLSAGQNIKTIKENCCKLLLQDVEKYCKRPEAGRKLDGKFNPKFYENLKENDTSQWPAAFKEFLQVMVDEEGPNSHCPEAISAKMLLELGKSSNLVDSSGLKQELDKSLAEFKTTYSDQTSKDITTRMSIFLKVDEQETRKISFEELKQVQEKGLLTGEQFDFLKSAWQQGSYMSGAIVGMMPTQELQAKEYMLHPDVNNLRTDLLIEIKTGKDNNEKKVVFSNSQTVPVFKDDPFQPEKFYEAAFTLDASKMTGDHFTFGCSAAAPDIKLVIINSNNPNFPALQVPPGVKQDHPGAEQKLHEGILANRDQALTEVIKTKELPEATLAFKILKLSNPELAMKTLVILPPKNQEEQLSQIDDAQERADWALTLKLHKIDLKSNDLQAQIINLSREFGEDNKISEPASIYAKLVQNYIKIEPNDNKCKEFAVAAFDAYSSQQNKQILNSKEVEKIADSMVKIFSPICQSDEEKNTLKRNAQKIIRECAKEEGQKMTWGQAWKGFKERTSDAISQIFGKYKAKTVIMENNPEIIAALKHHLNTQASQAAAPTKSKVNNDRQR